MIARNLTLFTLALSLHGTPLAQSTSGNNTGWQSLEDFLNTPLEEPVYNPKLLGEGDVISVQIKNVPKLSDQYTIDKDGVIDFPLIGFVQAQGETPENLAERLAILYEKDYLVNPTVSISIFAKRLPQKDRAKLVNNTSDAIKIISAKADKKPLPRITIPETVDGLANAAQAQTERIPERLNEPELLPLLSSDMQVKTMDHVFANSPDLTVTPIEPSVLDTAPSALLPETEQLFQAIEQTSLANIHTIELEQDVWPVGEETNVNFIESPSPDNTLLELVNSHWSINGSDQDFIQFLSGGDIAGALGCNSFFARYEQADAAINIHALTTTLTACADNTKPQEFIDTLKTAKSYLIYQGELQLLDDQSNSILFLHPK